MGCATSRGSGSGEGIGKVPVLGRMEESRNLLLPARFCPFPSLPALHPDHAPTVGFFPLSQALWESQQQLPSPCQALIFLTPQPPHEVTVALTPRHGTESHQTHPTDAVGTKAALGEAEMPGEGGIAASSEESAPLCARGSPTPHPGRGLCLHRARLRGHSHPGHGLARLPVTAGRPQPLARADVAQLEGTVHVLQRRSDLTAGLAELAGKKPRCLMPHSAPTRIISSYFHGKACHFWCVCSSPACNPTEQQQL